MAPGAFGGGGGGIMDCEEGRGAGGGRDRGGLADAAWGAVLATFCRMSARIYVNMCECVEKRVTVSA